MKIAYMCPFNGVQCGESEARTRIKYCLEELGHELIEIDKKNKLFNNDEIHIDAIGADFVFSHGVTEQVHIVYPDIFSTFFYWCPASFLSAQQGINYISYLNKHDSIVGGYESEKTIEDLKNNGLFDYDSLLKFGASVPKDWAILPKNNKDKRVFYVGMNVESKFKNMRYADLIQYLCKNDLIDIYGQDIALGLKKLWSGFKGHKGSIPFDGKTILSKINEAGICLALNSDVHNNVDYVSNRIYEAAAAGSVIISDDNKYVRRYFKDSVYYVDVQQPEEKIIEDIIKIIEDINLNPQKAYEMACEAQRIFVEELSLEKQVENLINYLIAEKNKITNIDNQKDIVDVICYIDKIDDFQRIHEELKSQYYQNLHLLIVSTQETYEKIKSLIDYSHTFIEREKYRGDSLSKAKNHLQGNFFLLMDGYSAMHKNHINKHLYLLSKRDNLFVYSGTYIRLIKDGITSDYKTLNFRPLSKDLFLLFTKDLDTNVNAKFKFENNFALNSVLFKKEILNYSEDIELKQISTSPHLYLACCSIIKAKKHGRFSYTISSGYELSLGEKVNELFEFSRKYYNKYGKAGNLTCFELASVFFKYDYEVNMDLDLIRFFKNDKHIVNFLYRAYKPFYILDKMALKVKLFFTLKKEKREEIKYDMKLIKRGIKYLILKKR